MLGALIMVCGFLTVLVLLWLFSPWLAWVLVIIAGIAGVISSHLDLRHRQKQMEQRIGDLERTVHELSRGLSAHTNNEPSTKPRNE